MADAYLPGIIAGLKRLAAMMRIIVSGLYRFVAGLKLLFACLRRFGISLRIIVARMRCVLACLRYFGAYATSIFACMALLFPGQILLNGPQLLKYIAVIQSRRQKAFSCY